MRQRAEATTPPPSEDADARARPRRAQVTPTPHPAPTSPASHADVRAVRIVRRRRDVVLRHEGLEHLRLRRPQTQTLQSQEHGRSGNLLRPVARRAARADPLSLYPRHHTKAQSDPPPGNAPGCSFTGARARRSARSPQRAGDGRRRGHRQRQPRRPDDLAQRQGDGQRRRAARQRDLAPQRLGQSFQ